MRVEGAEDMPKEVTRLERCAGNDAGRAQDPEQAPDERRGGAQDIDINVGKEVPAAGLRGEIELCDIRFTYQMRPDVEVYLDAVCHPIRAKQLTMSLMLLLTCVSLCWMYVCRVTRSV